MTHTQPNFTPPTNFPPKPPATVATAKGLSVWFTLLQVLAGLQGGTLTIALLAGGAIPSLLATSDVGAEELGAVGLSSGMFLVGSLLLVLLVIIAVASVVFMFGWGKEWVTKLTAFLYPASAVRTMSPTLHPAELGDPRPRLGALSDTLGRWMVGTAWASAIAAGLSMLGALAAMYAINVFSADITGGMAPLGFGSSVGWLYGLTLFSMLGAALGGVLFWQLCMRLRDYLAHTTQALSGGSTAKAGASSKGLALWLKYWVWLLGGNMVLSVLLVVGLFAGIGALGAVGGEFSAAEGALASGFGMVSGLLGMLPSFAVMGLLMYIIWQVKRFVELSANDLMRGRGEPLETAADIESLQTAPPFLG